MSVSRFLSGQDNLAFAAWQRSRRSTLRYVEAVVCKTLCVQGQVSAYFTDVNALTVAKEKLFFLKTIDLAWPWPTSTFGVYLALVF